MEEKNIPAENSSDALDLSALSSLSLEPSWASGEKKEKISIGRSFRDDRRRGEKPFRRERSPRGNANSENSTGTPNSRHNDFRHGKKSGERFHGKPHGRIEHLPPPRVVDVSFFPEEKPFSVLSEAIKKSARTYELFEIANLILEKPERFVVAIKPFSGKKPFGKNDAKKTVPAPADSVPAEPAKEDKRRFFVSVPDGMPFLSESDALAYVFDNFAEKFFDIETVEIDPPKGNFTMIAKCGFSGELLAPPNYHGYQQILRDFHVANFSKMPFEKFLSRIETVKDTDAIETWLSKMKSVVRYTIKDRKDGEPETLDGAGAAKAFLATNRKTSAVRETPTVHIPGKLLERMPMNPMKTSIEAELAAQRRFPLDTANFLRGRLRHSGFALFKRGSKGVTLVCAVRRKFRTPESVFSDAIQRVFDFLEKNPNTKIQDLPKKMLGLDDVPATTENAAPAENSNAENAPSAVPEPDAEAQISELLVTVRWLVLEGYVSELSDGSLFTYPKMSVAQAKVAAKSDEVPASPSPANELSEALDGTPTEAESPANQDVPATSDEEKSKTNV